MKVIGIHLLTLFLPIVAACGGAQPPVEAPPPPPTPSATTPATTPAGEPASKAAAWDSMSKAQHMDLMMKVVLPKMKEELTAFDPKRFAKVNCKTCHGAGSTDGTFKMPNAGLPQLSPADGYKKHMDKDPEITKFMMTKTLPTMAGLIGEPVWDPKTQKGFSCFECHTEKK